jgi:stage II sporulation protein D
LYLKAVSAISFSVGLGVCLAAARPVAFTPDAVGGSHRLVVKTVVNGRGHLRHMDTEQYVAAVLQAEATAFDSDEALKAMAVVVRSYALRNEHRHGAAGLCDGIHCQRLKFPVQERMLRAARATAGQALWHRGRLAEVFYHQDCGGVTAEAARVWGGGGQPYLVSRPDPYCERNPSNWRARVSREALDRVLGRGDHDVPATHARVRILGHSASGRVNAVSYGGHTWTGAQFRDLLSGLSGPAVIRSSRFSVVDTTADQVTFAGRGAGHGVGLCQHGALARGHAGHLYTAILAAYFPGTAVDARGHSATSNW